jgi:cell wall-associated NlpC family hydrolase
MRFWIGLVSLIVLLQGCATQLASRPASRSDDPETEAARQVLQFQRSSIEPRSADGLLRPEDLRPGDIILTSVPTLGSASIRLMTFAPVSHSAVYIGDRQVVEAVPSGVRVRRLDALLAEEAVVLAFRHPDLSAEQARSIRAYVLKQIGTNFNFLGIALHVPFTVNRRLCKLPLMPSVLRDACIRSIGAVYHLVSSQRQFFCSQLVLQAYRQAGAPITDVDPRLITPADILHMREGDVPSVRIHTQLRHVGHLKYQPPLAVAFQQ